MMPNQRRHAPSPFALFEIVRDCAKFIPDWERELAEPVADADGAGESTPEPTPQAGSAPAYVAARGHIAFTLSGLGAGGAERVVSIIANAMVKRGWRVSIISFAHATTTSYYHFEPDVERIDLGLPPERRSWLTGKLRAVARTIRMRQALRQVRPDIVLSFLARTNIIVLLATIGVRVPVVVSVRNNPHVQTFGPIWSLLRAVLYPRAFGVVTMTQGAMDFFPKWMRRREWVIPNPVILNPPMQSSPADTKVVTAVGRLVPQKGFDLLLQAFARIADSYPAWNMVIWGEGPERDALERDIARLGIEGRARLSGVSLMPGSWVNGADLFVMSSRYEGWGNVLLEALAAGIPAVSFDCPWGPGQMIEDGVNGLLAAPEDVPALADKLARLMRDPDLRVRLGAEARRSAEHYAPARIVAAWEGLVEAALAQGKTGQASKRR